MALNPSRGCGDKVASKVARRRAKGPRNVSPADQNRERDHWFMAPARI